MRTKRATAPQNLEVLLESNLVRFTVADVADLLGLTLREARAAIVFGVQLEKIWVIKNRQEVGEQWAVYENPKWRRKWVTQSWRL